MLALSPKAQIEENIRKEFRAAFNEMQGAQTNQKAEAETRLNRAVRTLYDFVAHGKTPRDLPFRRFDVS